mmetsp:Transcript_14567/g.22229  ORF Transcript_14567/g.22229 Transcript_14567/m.22229 type:complete len:97 (+) Transcript_14567:1329-1619(+)
MRFANLRVNRPSEESNRDKAPWDVAAACLPPSLDGVLLAVFVTSDLPPQVSGRVFRRFTDWRVDSLVSWELLADSFLEVSATTDVTSMVPALHCVT